MKNIFTNVLYEMEKGHDLILATLVSISGSAPRGAGAMMLTGMEGIISGTVGGGPSEAKVIDMAKELIRDKKSKLHDFRLYTNDIDDIGAICGGDIAVHMQFIDSSDSNWNTLATQIVSCIENRTPKTLVINMDGSHPKLIETETKENVYDIKTFNMPLPIGEKVYVFGAGHCAKALVPILDSVGFRVTVMDNRPELLTKESFPNADELVCEEYDRVNDIFNIGGEDYVVIMTAGHSADYLVEERVIRKDPAYLGVIGSRSKLESIRERLRNDGVSEDRITAVHSPIGIKIHSVTPEEVAVSIAAQMISERFEHRQKMGVIGEKICPV